MTLPFGVRALVLAPSDDIEAALNHAFHVTELLGFRAVHYRGSDVLRDIGGDDRSGDGDWTLVLDARARLHPDAASPRRLLALAMQREHASGLIHLGLHAASCAVWPWPWAVVARGCSGEGGSSSFLITRRRARAMSEMRGGTVLGSFVAPHLRSDGDLRGLVTHPRSTPADHLHALPPPPTPLPCFGAVLNSRLGNLMFEYASLVGICVRRGFPPATCASLSGNVLDIDRVDLPIRELVETFSLPTPFCAVAHDALRYQEHAHKPHAIEFDPDTFRQPMGTVFVGYMQSFKYFSPHADAHVRRAFRFPATPRAAAVAFLASVRRHATSLVSLQTGPAVPPAAARVVCASVRRGDKVGRCSCPPRSLPTPSS